MYTPLFKLFSHLPCMFLILHLNSVKDDFINKVTNNLIDDSITTLFQHAFRCVE